MQTDINGWMKSFHDRLKGNIPALLKREENQDPWNS
jgi:hypothetical protein